MTITVRQLVEIPDLGTWIYAGISGADREIIWAHVSELPDPTEWLDSGELLMTTGLGMPEEPTAQREYVERLAEAGLSGLLIARHMHEPELSKELSSVADERSLPVLLTAYEVPFTAIGRAVADANAGEQRERLAQMQRIYDMLRSSSVGSSGAELLSRLGRLLDCELHVLDPARGVPLLPSAPPAPEEIVAMLVEADSERYKPIPALLRLQEGSRPAMAMAVPASRPAAMVALPLGEEEPDLSVLRHVTSVAALEIEREKAERERRRRLGSEILAGLIDRRTPVESAVQLLTERDLGEEPRVLAACLTNSEAEHSDLHLKLEDRSIPHLLLRRVPFLTTLLPDAPEAIHGLREEVGSSVAIGLSDPLSQVSRVPEANREAKWALHGAHASGEPLARYAEDAASAPFFPRSLDEAERVVHQVLGNILDYDATHDTPLVKSLDTFLARNRSWKDAAAALHVHKQTLVYRMHRVEEISGKNLNQTQDVAELWLTLRTAEAAGLLDLGSSDSA